MKKIDPKRTDLTAEERRLLMLQGLEDAKTKGIGKKAGGMMKKGYAKGKMVKKMMAGGKTKKMMSAGKLVGGQKKLDKNNDGKISGDDFAKMKAGGMTKKSYAQGKMVKKGMAAGGKAKGKAKGGKSKVRGAGIARKGVRAAKMR